MTANPALDSVSPLPAASHPAPWHPDALEKIADILNTFTAQCVLGPLASGPERLRLVDPMAGGGSIYRLTDDAMLNDPRWEIVAGEIEPDFARADGRVMHGGAIGTLAIERCAYGRPAAIVFSPPFGNRMADTYEPPETDDSVRHTYTVALGHKPDPDSAAGARWGPRYRGLMAQIYDEVVHTAGNDTIVIVEMADHIKDGQRIAASQYTRWALQLLGLQFVRTLVWRTRPVRYATSEIRVDDDLHIFLGRIAAPSAGRDIY